MKNIQEPAYEMNFDGIVGQTHNYSGLSFGNIASMENRQKPSNPKSAALQGLEKMKLLYDLGIMQGVFPPHERPHIPTLRALGFCASDRLIPECAYKAAPAILYLYSSASPMWAANSLTFTPSIDSLDKKAHITAANLASTRHRALESEDMSRILQAIFPSKELFTHHRPLPFGNIFNDEGAANHTRFCKEYSGPGVHLFVYGQKALGKSLLKPRRFPARQTEEASLAIIRSHKIDESRVVLAQQAPKAIDLGVFHNDVVSVGDRNLFFFHEKAFSNSKEVLLNLKTKADSIFNSGLHFIRVPEKKLPLKKAVKTYVFNSQIISNKDQTFSLIAPKECEKDLAVSKYLKELIENPAIPIKSLYYAETKESMQNGGGPACLRTRIPLNQKEIAAVNKSCLFDEKLYNRLKKWIHKHYRDNIIPKDLSDPNLVDEVQEALHELTEILNLGSVYSFQRNDNS